MESTYLQLVLQQIFLGGHFAIEAEKTLFIRAHLLPGTVSVSAHPGAGTKGLLAETHAGIDLVLLVGVHLGEMEGLKSAIGKYLGGGGRNIERPAASRREQRQSWAGKVRSGC